MKTQGKPSKKYDELKSIVVVLLIEQEHIDVMYCIDTKVVTTKKAKNLIKESFYK